VRVYVYEAREEVQAVRIEVTRAPQVLTDLGDMPGREAHVRDAVQATRGIEDVSAADY
jgi:hypothetical protein